jgi:formylmethanofuran dehydrogenase subunit E
MTRIFILIVLAGFLYLIIKRVIASAKAQNTNKTEQEANKKKDEKILQCCQCGCHVPESDTKIINDKIICNNPDCNKLSDEN